MKKIKLFSLSLLIILFFGCGDDDENTIITGDGQLVHLESALDDVFYEWMDLTYDEDQNLTKIKIQVESFLEQTYEVTYNSNELVSLTHTVDNSIASSLIIKDYDIIQQGDEITLRTSDEGDKYLYRITEGYIDYCKAYFGTDNEYFNEIVFTRNAENNIEKIEYFVTDANSSELKVYEYTFTDHSSTFDFPGAYNPVLNFSFTGFDAHLGEIMGLKISNQAPLKSSYWDAGGTFREENIIATPVVENGVLQELSYGDMGTGKDNYLLKLSYN